MLLLASVSPLVAADVVAIVVIMRKIVLSFLMICLLVLLSLTRRSDKRLSVARLLSTHWKHWHKCPLRGCLASLVLAT